MFLSLTLYASRDNKPINIPDHLSILYFAPFSAVPDQGCEIMFLNGTIFHVKETEDEIISRINEIKPIYKKEEEGAAPSQESAS